MITTNPPLAGERETLTIAEMAELLGISRTVCYELAARDELPVPTLRVGRQYRFSRRAFDELMQSQHTPSTLVS
jgi:excisionase family DNA binding protein